MRDLQEYHSTSESDALQPLSLSTRLLPQEQRFEYLNDIYAVDFVVLAPTRLYGLAVNSDVKRWKVNDVDIVEAYNQGHISKFTGRRQDHVLIRKYVSGKSRIWRNDFGVYDAELDDILIMNSVQETIVSEATDLRTVNLFIPLDTLEFTILKDRPPILIRHDTMLNRLLTSAIEIWLAELQNLRTTNVATLEASIVGIVSGLLRQGTLLNCEPLFVKRVCNHAVRRFIDENLGNPDLGPDFVKQQFPGSRASLYREFSEEGGVARYITRRRLELALTDLAAGPARRGQITKTAMNVGYVDPIHFSKSFKNHFGFRPSDVLSLSESGLNTQGGN